jgi:hypothetical protein
MDPPPKKTQAASDGKESFFDLGAKRLFHPLKKPKRQQVRENEREKPAPSQEMEHRLAQESVP